MNTKPLPSLEALNSSRNTFRGGSQKTSHGYRFEEIVCKVFGFCNDDGTPWNQYGDLVDVPKKIVKRSDVPEKYHADWSIKLIQENKAIGYGTAIKRRQEATRPIVHCVGFWGYRGRGAKKIVGFNYSLVTPSQADEHWGNITLELLEEIDPCLNKNHSISRSKEITKKINNNRTGIIGERNCSRECNSNGYPVRNLQAYVGSKNYMEHIDDGLGVMVA